MRRRNELRYKAILYLIGCLFAALTLVSPVQAQTRTNGNLGYGRDGVKFDANDFALKDGDRVLFYGDSITEQRLYTSYVEQYVLTRFPDRHISFINTGWGGDSVTHNGCVPCAGVGGLARLKRDVIDHKPTVVTLLFGMNDGDYREFDPAIMKVFVDGLTEIIHGIKSGTKARIYVMTPTVYDGTRHTSWSHTDKYNDTLDRYSEAAKELAAKEGLAVIDLHSVTTEALRKAKTADPSYTFLDDGVHPQPDGQLVMAAEILRAWGANPNGVEIVAHPAIDASGNSAFEVTAPLPWPIPLPSAKLQPADPSIMSLGEIKLRLTGVPPGSFAANIDGADVAGSVTSEQLTNGINLGELSKPSLAASTALAQLIRQRAELFFLRWRQVEVPYAENYANGRAAVSALDALVGNLTDREREQSKPREYKITIRKVG